MIKKIQAVLSSSFLNSLILLALFICLALEHEELHLFIFGMLFITTVFGKQDE